MTDAFDEHINYEIQMLQFTFTKIQELAVETNAMIEAFCIHARNLDEFFEENGKQDTLKARAFTRDTYAPFPRDKRRDDLIRKIHKQISHLTRDRVGAEKIDGKDRLDLLELLLKDVKNFQQHRKTQAP